jgi:hypothetical protein
LGRLIFPNTVVCSRFLASEAQCAHELDKARLIIGQNEKEIDWLKEENERLKEIIALLKAGESRAAEQATAKGQ